MSHNLADKADGTGKAMFSVRETPWHKLGTVVEHALTAEEAIKIAGLDYEVQRFPLLADATTEDEAASGHANFSEVPNHYATVRTDTKQVLGVVGSRYTIIQNKSAFEFLDAIAGTQGEAHFETAGALGRGERIWVNLRLPEDVKVAGEEIAPYFLCANSHDASLSLKLFVTPVRVVCANTLNLSLSQAGLLKGQKPVGRSVSIRHTRRSEEKIVEAKRILGMTREYYRSFAQVAEDLVRQKFTKAQFEDLAKSLLPVVKEDSHRGQAEWDQAFEKLIGCWEADDLNNIRGTKWAAFNAVADYSDHSRDVRGSEQAKLEKLFTRSFEDTILKDKAFAILA